MTYIFKVKSSILLTIFEHEYLPNGLVRRDQTLQGSCLGQGPFARENAFCYVMKGSPQDQKFKNVGGRNYLKIGKPVCCKIYLAGSHMTGNEYLRKKFGYLLKLGFQEDF